MKLNLYELKTRVDVFKRNMRDTFDNQDEATRTQRTIITENAMNNVAANLAGGNFFTGLLLFLNASTIQIGLVNIIAYVCNIAQLLAPLFIERFETRKKLLVITRIIHHISNIVLIGLLSILPASESTRVYLILGVQAFINLMSAFTSAGYSVWHIQSIPDRDRAHYFSLNQRITSTAAYIFMLLGSAIADQFRGTPNELTGYLILRSVAILFAIADVYFLSRIKEYPYPKSEHKVNLKMILTEPLKAKRYRVSLLVIVLWNTLATTCGSYYSVYILDTVKASYTFLNICSALYTPFLLVLAPIWARYINRTSWFSVYWKAVIVYGIFYLLHPFVTVNNYLWMYPLVQVLLFTLSPAINLFHSNLAYYNIPQENQTIYLSFYSTIANVAAIIGNLFATQFMLHTEGVNFNLFGIPMQPGQFLPLITGFLIILIGVIVFFINKNEEKIKKEEEAAREPVGEYDGPF